jgi:8-oxo-dGTP diphosphatase
VHEPATEMYQMELERPRELKWCPHCGSALIDRPAFGRIRQFCPVCMMVVFREHKVAAGIIVGRGNGVLLTRRRRGPRKGLWTFPGGFVDYDEDPVTAAVRECREETGLEVRVAGLLDVISGREHAKGADIVIVYTGHIVGGALRAGDDADKAAFFSLDRLPELAFSSTRRAVERYARVQQLVGQAADGTSREPGDSETAARG